MTVLHSQCINPCSTTYAVLRFTDHTVVTPLADLKEGAVLLPFPGALVPLDQPESLL